MEKRIELVKMKAGDIKTGFGNPRKISKAKLDELEQSITDFGDFGVYLIDEKNNVIAGNQRLKVILKKFGPDAELDCKRLIGYTKSELRAINIKDNTHSGEWDLDGLADWTADLNVDLGIDDKKNLTPDERKIPEMEPLHYEKYDYVMIVCRSVLDYNDLVRKLGIEGKKVSIATRKINARAIWYDKMEASIVPNDELDRLRRAYTGSEEEAEYEESNEGEEESDES